MKKSGMKVDFLLDSLGCMKRTNLISRTRAAAHNPFPTLGLNPIHYSISLTHVPENNPVLV